MTFLNNKQALLDRKIKLKICRLLIFLMVSAMHTLLNLKMVDAEDSNSEMVKRWFYHLVNTDYMRNGTMKRIELKM